jgi:hypothetical protein
MAYLVVNNRFIKCGAESGDSVISGGRGAVKYITITGAMKTTIFLIHTDRSVKTLNPLSGVF